jgi:hypothetical protein
MLARRVEEQTGRPIEDDDDLVVCEFKKIYDWELESM